MKMKETIGIGTDIVDIKRLRGQNLQRIAHFFLLPKEKQDMKKSRDKAQFAASRWAAKEAVIKSYPGKIGPKDIQIVKIGKKPSVHFKRAKDKNLVAFLSIAHDFDYAVAYAILCR